MTDEQIPPMRVELAWFGGIQQTDNAADFMGLQGYLCEPPAAVVRRIRYAAHMGIIPDGSSGVLVYYVDPEFKIMLGQRIDGMACSRPGQDERWPFKAARKFARRAFNAWRSRRETGKVSVDDASLERWWASFLSWEFARVPPPPILIPAMPSKAYAEEWLGINNWLIKPKRAKGKAQEDESESDDDN